MDSLFVQSEQASDQSLFSQKTETTMESSSVNSQVDTMPIEEATQELLHSRKDFECSSNRTVAGCVKANPETEQLLSPQEDKTEVSRETNVQPEPMAACPLIRDSVDQEYSASSCSEPGEKNCSDNVPSNDVLSPQANGDASHHKKCKLVIGDDPPADQAGESGCVKGNRLLDSDDDATSDLKLHATNHSPDKKCDPRSQVPYVFDSSDEEPDGDLESAPFGDGEGANVKEPEGTEHSSGNGGELSHSHARRIFDSSDEEENGAAKEPVPVGNEGGHLEDLEESASTHSAHKKGRGERKSAKKAMEELREIYSTSQRMTRERQMSLPYHEPERLSLRAFLQQRRSGESHSSPVCKKEEKTIVPHPENSSSVLLLDDVASSFTGPTDHKPAEPSTANTVSPDKQPPGNSAQPSHDEKSKTPLLSSRRRRTLEALAAGTVPCLSKEPVILLDDDSDHPEGVDRLLKRLVKHSKMEDSKKKKETVKAAAIIVPGIIEEGPVPEKGVSQLTLLKEKLLSKVRQQRNRSREQRYLQRCLDNEELPPDGAVHMDDDAPKSPLALADELDEDEEDDFSDAHETSSGDEEAEDEDGNSSDEEVVLKHKKRVKKVNPVSDDEDEEDKGKMKSPFGKKVLEEEEEDSDGELHLEMPAFPDAEDNVDEAAIGDENRTGSFVDSPLPANREKTAQTPLNRKYGAMRSYQPDETELFSPLTGLPRTQSKTDTPKQGGASASSSFQESPSYSTVSGAPTLAFSPLAGTTGALTACRSLRRQFSEDLAKPWEGGTPGPANPSQDMEELVGLCSGSFAARTQAEELEENEDNDDDDDILKASQGELDEDEADSDEDEAPARSRDEPAPRLKDFLEEEAELSGSDVGSDGEEDEDEEGVLADLIAVENGKEDTDQIREEIGRFHFKQLLDEDKRELKIYQELLLEDGDLHTDGAGRQRQFRWRNSGAIGDENLQAGSDGEEDTQRETEQEADATWRLQRLERRRWLQEQDQRPDTPSSGSFSEQDSLLKAPTVIAKQDSRLSKKVAKKGAICGSFLGLDSGVLGRIAERIKVAVPTETEGSVTTKNFVFRAAENKPKKKRLSTSQLSQEPKKAKLKELSEQRDLAISVFNFI